MNKKTINRKKWTRIYYRRMIEAKRNEQIALKAIDEMRDAVNCILGQIAMGYGLDGGGCKVVSYQRIPAAEFFQNHVVRLQVEDNKILVICEEKDR